MASQQILFAETIAGMKKAFKRKAYESDSDSEIESYSNRGNKLKKRARFAHKGQLVPSSGPSSYRQYVEYDGARRAIIQRNPPLIDDEGYEVDSDDDDERLQEAELSAADLNPYANIHIEHILAPLTASTALPTHPTLSKPFVSKTLTRLVDQSCDIMRKENHSLWQVRHLLTALCGDYTWVPCETMVRPADAELYNEDLVARHLLSLAKNDVLPPLGSNGDTQMLLNGPNGHDHGDGAKESQQSGTVQAEEADVPMADAETNGGVPAKQQGNGALPNGDKEKDGARSKPKTSEGPAPTGKRKALPDGQKSAPSTEESASLKPDGNIAVAGEESGSPSGVQQLISVGEALGAQDGSVATSDSLEHTFVHPMFLAPSGAKPDRDVGLPEPEADDVRRLLALYVQKQEEVCRGAKKLFLGLLRAEKLRKDVLHWSKAEAHAGPNRDMSDGEDWYDKEEWGLTEDLKKGQDEEEEDTQTTGKKTRNRRT